MSLSPPSPRQRLVVTMLDLFMNFGMALAWILCIAPPGQTQGAQPEPPVPPVESSPGERPGAGQEVAKVTVRPGNGATEILYHGKKMSVPDFLRLWQEEAIPFPDHFVLRFEQLPDLQTLTSAALTHDAAVSIELPR